MSLYNKVHYCIASWTFLLSTYMYNGHISISSCLQYQGYKCGRPYLAEAVAVR